MEKPKLLLEASFLIFDPLYLGTVENKMVRSTLLQNKIIREFGQNKIVAFCYQYYWPKKKAAHV